MRNLKNNLIILNIIVFVILFISYDTKELEYEDNRVIKISEISNLHKIELINIDSNYTFLKRNFSWEISNPINWKINDYTISNFINILSHSKLTKLFTYDEIKSRGEVLKDYGIEDSSITFHLYYGSNKNTLKIGKTTRDEKSLYCTLKTKNNDETSIWRISSEIKNLFDIPLTEWADLVLVPNQLYEIDDIALTFRSNHNKKTRTRLYQTNGDWFFSEPFKTQANGDEVRFVLNKILSENILDFQNENESLNENFDFEDIWEIKIDINCSNKINTFFISKERDDLKNKFRYCKVSYSEHVLKVNEEFSNYFSDWTTKLRNRNIFQIHSKNINRIEISNKQNEFEIIKKDNDQWILKSDMYGNKYADSENVEWLINKLNTIEVNEFLSFNPTEGEISTFNDLTKNFKIKTYSENTSQKTVIVSKNLNEASLWKTFVVEDSLLCLVGNELNQILDKKLFELEDRNLMTNFYISEIELIKMDKDLTLQEITSDQEDELKKILSNFKAESFVNINGKNDGTWENGNWVPWSYKLRLIGKLSNSDESIEKVILISKSLGATRQIGKFVDNNTVFNLPINLINNLKLIINK